jgi:polyisoprenoid-binding protein YceI
MIPEILVFTFKDGLLARLAHDLQIRCDRFEISREGNAITGRFTLSSLRVDGAVERGRVADGVLSASDRKKIEATMHDDVLDVARFGEATFRGTLAHGAGQSRATITGTLALHGREVELANVGAELRGGRWITEITLVPSRWGIAPYRALAGALKLQDRVIVRVSLDDASGQAASWTRE